MKEYAFLVSGIVILSMLAAAPAAGQEFIFDLEIEDIEEYFGIGERDLVVHEETYTAYISSYMEEEEDELFFDFSITADSELWIGANYGRYNGDGFESSGMQVRFLGLVEYFDENENGQFDPTSDHLVSGLPLSGDFYSSDLIMGAGDFTDIQWDDEPNIWDPIEWDDTLMEVYNLAFMTGWELGFEQGIDDQDVGSPFNSDPAMMLEDPDFMGFLLEFIETTLIGIDEELLYDAYEWAWTGLTNGYMMGYELGWGEEPYDPYEDDGTDDLTRSGDTHDETGMEKPYDEEFFIYPPGMSPDEMWGQSQRYIPLYDPIDVEYIEHDNGTEEVRVEVWDSDGHFGIACKVTNIFSMIENGYLSPTSMKIDILIEDYPYVDTDTDIAVLMDWGVISMKMDSPELEFFDESYYQTKGLTVEEEEFRMGSSSFKGFLSWVKYAECDGDQKEVKVSTYNSFYGDYIDETGGFSENFRSVVISYPRSVSIYHDPKIGFIEIEGEDVLQGLADIDEISDGMKGNIIVFMISAVAVTTFIGITWKRRGPSR